MNFFEVHVNVPEWKLYKFQFSCKKCLSTRDAIIEEVVYKGLLNQRSHLPYIVEAKRISKEEFLPDDQMYFKSIMNEIEYERTFKTNPSVGKELVDKRSSFKVKKIYAKKEEPWDV